MKTSNRVYIFEESETDEELVKLSLKNPLYFENIVLRYQKPIIGFHYNYLKNSDDAEDLAQDTFFKVYLNLGRFNGEKGRFKDWIFKIAKNISIDFWRKKIKKNSEYPASEFFSAEKEKDFTAADAPGLAYNNSLKREINKYLEMLKPEEKDILKKFYFDGLSHGDLEGSYFCGINTIKSRLHRARLSLRKILEAENFTRP